MFLNQFFIHLRSLVFSAGRTALREVSGVYGALLVVTVTKVIERTGAGRTTHSAQTGPHLSFTHVPGRFFRFTKTKASIQHDLSLVVHF